MHLTRRKSRRRGFTLVEMLVAAALCMLIMVILTGAFSSGIEAFRQLKATGDMASKLRQATALLRRDLAAQHFDGEFKPGLSGPYLSDQRLDRVGWVPPEQGYVKFYSPRVHREGRDADGVPSTRMRTPYDLPANTVSPGTDVSRFPAFSMTVKLPGNSLAEVVQANMPYAGGQTPPGQLAAVSLYEFGGNNTFVSKWSEVSYYLVARGDTTISGFPLYTLYRKQTAMHPDGASGVKNTAGANYPAPAAGTSLTNPVNNSDFSQVYPVRTAAAPAGPPSDPNRYAEIDPNKYTRFASPAEATMPNYKIPNAAGTRNATTMQPQGLVGAVGTGANRPNLHRLPLPTDRNAPVTAVVDAAQDQPVLHEVISMETRFLWETLVITDPNGNSRQMHAIGGDTQGLMQASVGYANPLLAGVPGVDPLSRQRADNGNISDVDDANATVPFRELPRYTYAPLRAGTTFSYGYRPGGLNTAFVSPNAYVRQDTGAAGNFPPTVGAVGDINYAIYRPEGLQFKDTFDTWTRRSLPLQFPNLQYVNWNDSSIAPPIPQGAGSPPPYRAGNPYEDMKFVTDPNTANNVPTGALVPWEDRPPLRIRIRAVQIKLRVWDAKTQQSRQVTIVQDV